MIAILHGYLLEGSGSNLWTRSIVRSLCENGHTVHLMCQENHPELYDFINSVIVYDPDGTRETLFDRQPVYPGRCIMHKPKLGDTLPVYVRDKYEEFSNPQPMVQLDDAEIEKYLDDNIRVLGEVVDAYQIQVIHANHAVLMSVVAQRVAESKGIPYAIMPHGSAIEYAVKKDKRFFDLAESAFRKARRIYVIGDEIRSRIKNLFPELPLVESRMMDLNLGVDTKLFNPVKVEERKAKIQELTGLLKQVKRGKILSQEQYLQENMKADIPQQALQEIIRVASSYNAKLTDESAEKKLETIHWEQEKIILFVGRLIASKGLHSVITALPEILAAEPDTRLIIVGHGPQREPMEALIWALRNGHKELVLKLVDWGRELEDNGSGSLEETQQYFIHLQSTGKLDHYFQKAQRYLNDHRIVFTGYLTHTELCKLFPVCDVAVFPSVVPEAGPLVFLEAMASGCFPIGTYFAGMAASIDSVSHAIPPEISELMKLSPQADHTVRDIANHVTQALHIPEVHKESLRSVTIEKYDWSNISLRLSSDLHRL
jgi:glycosyltransferase involved in cell wall biosynthesis